jgi:hypothetical protein
MIVRLDESDRSEGFAAGCDPQSVERPVLVLLRQQGHPVCGLRDDRRDGLRLRHVDGVTPQASTTVEPARLDIAHCASGGIILSSVDTRDQLGFVLHAGSVIASTSFIFGYELFR